MVSSLSWATLPRQRVNYSLPEAAARAVGVQMCCCCALRCQLTSLAVMTAAGIPQPAWDNTLLGPVGWRVPRTQLCSLHMGLAPCRVAACVPHQSCLPQSGFTICSFTFFLVFHEHLEHGFGREYDFKSEVKSLVQPQMFKNTKMNLRETSCALDWLTALRKKKKQIPQGKENKTTSLQPTNHTPPPPK